MVLRLGIAGRLASRAFAASEARDPNRSIDWGVRKRARAKLRVMVRRILRKHGYPPDKQEQATRTILEQAELLSGEWAA